MQDMRGYRFCEVGLITGTSQDDAGLGFGAGGLLCGRSAKGP